MESVQTEPTPASLQHPEESPSTRLRAFMLNAKVGDGLGNEDEEDEEDVDEDDVVASSTFAWAVVCLVYPMLVLLAGFLSYMGVVTLFYVIAGLVFPFVRVSRVGFVRAHITFVWIVAVLQGLLLVIYSILMLVGVSLADWIGVLEVIGLIQTGSAVERMEVLLSPLLGFTACFLGSLFTSKLTAADAAMVSLPSLTSLFVLSVFFCSVWMPNLFSFLHWLFFCILVLVFAFGGDAMELCRRFSRFVALGIAVQLACIAVYRIAGVASLVAPIQGWLGVRELFFEADWPFYTQFASLLLSLLVTSQFTHQCSHDIRSYGVVDGSQPSVPDAEAVDEISGGEALGVRGVTAARYFFGVYGWTLGLFCCCMLSLIIQSAPFGVLLVLVFLAVWIPDSRLNVVVRIAALVVTVLISAMTFMFNVVAAATTSVEGSTVFVYLGLDVLSPFSPYIAASAITVSSLALHWRWRTNERTSAELIFAWVLAWLPGRGGELHDENAWWDGALMCELLRALGSPSMGPDDSSWDAAVTSLQNDWHIDHPNPRVVMPMLQQLRTHSLSIPRAAVFWVLSHSYSVAYLFLFFSAVSQVSVLNSVYLVFFLALLGAPSKRATIVLWGALAVYAQIFIATLFFWQFPFADSARSDVTAFVGLVQFDSIWVGLIWQSLTLALALTQLYVHRSSSEYDLRLDTSATPAALKFALYTMHWLSLSAVVLLIYLALLLVGVLGSVSLVTLVALGFLGVFVLADFVVSSARILRLVARVMWPLLIFWSAVVLVLSYMVQFPAFYDLLQGAFSGDGSVTLGDLGLRLEPDFGARILYLAGPAIVCALSVFHWVSVVGHAHVINISEPHQFVRSATRPPMTLHDYCWQNYPWLAASLRFVGRLFALHMPKVTVLVAFGAVAVSNLTLINGIYGLFATGSLLVEEGLASPLLGVTLIFYTIACMAGQLLFQLSFMQGFKGPIYDWVGFSQANVGVVAPSVVVLLMVLVQRWTSRLAEPDARVLGTTWKDRTEKRYLLLFDTDAALVRSDVIAPLPLAHKFGRLVSVAYAKFGFELVLTMTVLDAFVRLSVLSIALLGVVALWAYIPRKRALASFPVAFALMWLFIIAQYFFSLGLPSETSITFPWRDGLPETVQLWLCLWLPHPSYLVCDFMLLFLLGLSVQHWKSGFDVELLQGGDPAVVDLGRKRVARKSVITSVSTVATSPTSSGDQEQAADSLLIPLVRDANTTPRTSSPVEQQHDLIVEENKVIDGNDDDDDDDVVVAPAPPPSLSSSSGDNGHHQHQQQQQHHHHNHDEELDDTTAALLTLSEIKLFIANTAQYVALVVVFAAGVSAAELLSLFYVLFGLWFLLTFDALVRQPRKWLILQSYAFCVLVIKLVWQVPWIPDDLGSLGNDLVAAVGLHKLDLQSVFASTGVIFDLLIVFLIAVLNRLLVSEVYLALNVEQRRMENVSRVLLRSMRHRLVNAWVSVFQDQLERYKRLQKLQSAAEMDSWTTMRVHVQDVVSFTETEDEGNTPEKRPKTPISFASKLKDEQNDNNKGSSGPGGVDDDGDDNDGDDAVHVPAGSGGGDNDIEKLSWIGRFVSFVDSSLDSFVDFCYSYPWGERRDQVPQNRLRAVIGGAIRVLGFNTDSLCYFAFSLSVAFNANALSLVYAFAAFGYGNLVYPLPKRMFWNLCMIYTILMLLLKFFFRLPVFCVCANGGLNVIPYCTDPLCASTTAGSSFDTGIFWPQIVGISFGTAALVMDILVLMTLVLHRASLKRLGLWSKNLSYWKSTVDDRLVPGTEVSASGMRALFEKLKNFFLRVFQRIVPQSDFYMYIFLSEMLCFVFLVLFPNSFTGLVDIQATVVQQVFTSNLIPTTYLLLLLHQFVLIVVDRAIFLRQSAVAKLVLLYLQLVGYHVLLLFVLPYMNGVPFLQSPSLIIFYLLKCWYFFWSGRQICHGYPIVVESALMKNYGIPSFVAFVIYRAIPFLYEIKTLIEWTLVPTTLRFMDYFILDDIQATLFMAECNWNMIRTNDRKVGETQPWWMKFLLGVGLLVGLCLLLWFPLFLLSSANPSLQPNPVQRATLTVGLAGWTPFYVSATENVTKISGSTFSDIRARYRGFLYPEDGNSMQLVYFERFSEQVWPISPEGYQDLKTALALVVASPKIDPVSGDCLNCPSLETTFSFDRQSSGAQTPISGHFSARISFNHTVHLLDVLNYGINCTNTSITDPADPCNSVIAQKASPRFLRLGLSNPAVVADPSVTIALNLGLTRSVHTYGYRNSSGTFQIEVFSEFWSMTQVNKSEAGLFGLNGIVLAVISAEVPSFLGSLATQGILALYVGVVLTVGRFLRLAFTDLHSKLMWDQLENPVPLLQLCQDIQTARRFTLVQQDSNMADIRDRLLEFEDTSKMGISADLLTRMSGINGFVLEEQLYWRLVDISRNPAKLIALTNRPAGGPKIKID